jgi:hypothetical protein
MTSNDGDMEGSPAAHDAHLKVELSNREAGPLRASTKSGCALPPVKDSEKGSAGIEGGNAANESETRLKNGNEIGCAIRPAFSSLTAFPMVVISSVPGTSPILSGVAGVPPWCQTSFLRPQMALI